MVEPASATCLTADVQGLATKPSPTVQHGMTASGLTAAATTAAGKYAKIYFLSLFIENAAPGDAISSLLSRPMSSAVSANVYAVYCDR
jgi:hypothetical protein